MGCIQSKSSLTPHVISPNAVDQLETHERPFNHRARQNTQYAINGTPAEWMAYNQIENLHMQTSALLQHIETYLIDDPSLNTIHQHVMNLCNDLYERTLYFEGDPLTDYQERFNRVLSTLHGRVPPFQYSQPSSFSSAEIESVDISSRGSSPEILFQTITPR